ncbi:MAG TPA: phospholipase C, phosphocholine-specific [Lacipirellula sp.]
MDKPSRRDILKYTAALAATVGASSLTDAIKRAAAIAPAPGSTFLDAEHVVILMQENRSFDHAFGALRGARGFDDPRAIRLPDGNPVWVQTNDAGESYTPFRLGLLDTKSTWMGCLPHGWTDQVDARNGGRYDRWLQAKASGEPAYARLPLTLGYYDRRDIPFYYELADAFTICDQHFCSSLTGTTPNRCYLWSGTIRNEPKERSPAHLFNEEIDHDSLVSWRTFPERLEDLGVSWKVYQNDVYLEVGFTGEQGPWLSNFGDNPLEYFAQFHPRFAVSHRRYLQRRVQELSDEVRDLQARRQENPAEQAQLAEELAARQAELQQAQEEHDRWSDDNFARLSARDRSLHEKAFCTNAADPAYHELTEVVYRDGDQERRVEAPKGDVLHQFRADVQSGRLPAVSWLVAPERFSDHPGSAWYGAWYIAEALDILSQNPEVWRKTIFILTYDENDGYFDHVPPFAAPHPRRPQTGRVSASIDASVEYVDRQFEAELRDARYVRDSSIGLGYRVPMVVASPWSRGGWVCSQVFDHTSPVQLLERLLTHKLGREVKETNISRWRRAVCGDMSSAFRPADSASPPAMTPVDRDAYVEAIHRAQFKDLPAPGEPLTAAELSQARQPGGTSPRLPRQEPGQRPACPLPYELAADGRLSDDRRNFRIRLEAGAALFGNRAAGAPFTIYAAPGTGGVKVRNYAVAAGESVEDSWPLSEFERGRYHLAVHGPNGFFREFIGGSDNPPLNVRLTAQPASPRSHREGATLILHIENQDRSERLNLTVEDVSYGGPPLEYEMRPATTAEIPIDTTRSSGWYDVRIRVAGFNEFRLRYAGRVETGKPGLSDPLIGRS